MAPSQKVSPGTRCHAVPVERPPIRRSSPAQCAQCGKNSPTRCRSKALLIASAHWETNLPMLTGNARPETIHDFYGFPKPLYEIQYPAPGAPTLGERALALLKGAGFTAAIDGCRGLDHGAWSPLLYMYPETEVPVVQVSVQTPLGPAHHLALGRALAPLSREGILVFGSGHMTHNLRERRGDNAAPLAYVKEFQAWARAHRAQGLRRSSTIARAPRGARTPD
jgi:4,5-DOPA dioxygenase extradiol